MSKTAIDLLKKDHKKVKSLLKEIVESSNRASKKRERLLSQIKMELEIHTTIEEKIFYPAFHAKGGKKASVMFHEATEEHRAVEQLVLPDLMNTDIKSDQFLGRVKVLKELVEHHADEEEKEMFKRAKKLFSNDELEELAAKMVTLKKKLMKTKTQAKTK